jgi:hypothetical protein
MQRLRDYCGIIAGQTGLGYLVLWCVAYWTLAEGGAVFGKSGACHADSAQVLFYWACDPASPLQILATLANFALTTTVWAPVFVAAATVHPDAVIVAVPIVLVHVLGLPLGILVLIRLMARTFDAIRAFSRWALSRWALWRWAHPVGGTASTAARETRAPPSPAGASSGRLPGSGRPAPT